MVHFAILSTGFTRANATGRTTPWVSVPRGVTNRIARGIMFTRLSRRADKFGLVRKKPKKGNGLSQRKSVLKALKHAHMPYRVCTHKCIPIICVHALMATSPRAHSPPQTNVLRRRPSVALPSECSNWQKDGW